jgi:hypothetical protein
VLQAAKGGILKSQPGGTLVNAAEVGINEAFVPLPNGKKIPVEFGRELNELFKSSALKNLSTLDIVTPLNNILAKMTPSTGNESGANTATATQAGFDSKLLASTIAGEIRAAVKDMLQQPQNSDQSILVAVMQDMIREQKTTNTINQRILQVSQS